jgi:hypothetical protein
VCLPGECSGSDPCPWKGGCEGDCITYNGGLFSFVLQRLTIPQLIFFLSAYFCLFVCLFFCFGQDVI